MDVSPEDIRALVRDKYDGDTKADLTGDIQRLTSGEPLAYVIGWIPFLGCRIELASRPLIPRVETEYWTENLIAHLKERFGDAPFSLLDLCAGSGAIGIAVLKHLPQASVTFLELSPEHTAQIARNVEVNGIRVVRAQIIAGDLFSSLSNERFDVIATNPPYVPEGRALDSSVTDFEPAEALYAGDDGLSLIRRIAEEASRYLQAGGELWVECDISHAKEVAALLVSGGAQEATINEDQYGRPRFVVSYYP